MPVHTREAEVTQCTLIALKMVIDVEPLNMFLHCAELAEEWKILSGVLNEINI